VENLKSIILRKCNIVMINAVENSIRLITLGRKNYLFSGNDSGAEDNSIFYTLLGSCLQAGVEPRKWFKHLKKCPEIK